MTKPNPAVEVAVSTHAREQARARFPGFKAARIVDEVREALCDLRISAEKPPTLSGTSDPTCLYVWTPDMQRIYALRRKWDVFLVVTTMRANREQEGAA